MTKEQEMSCVKTKNTTTATTAEKLQFYDEGEWSWFPETPAKSHPTPHEKMPNNSMQALSKKILQLLWLGFIIKLH